MARNLKTLVTVAAGMRAVGHPWEDIAKEVHRKVKTCENWPTKHPELWSEIYGGVEAKRFEQMSKEVQTHLHGLIRDKDKRVQQRAIDLWTRHGAKAYGKAGSMVFVRQAEPEPKPAELDDPIWENSRTDLEEAWARKNKDRAQQGLPPLSQEEFIDEYLREANERDQRHSVPLILDANGNSIDPPEDGESFRPGDDLIEPDGSREGPARQAGPTSSRDVMWGVIVLALILTGRGPVTDSHTSHDSSGAMPTALREAVREFN